jgi:hypothetical protein
MMNVDLVSVKMQMRAATADRRARMVARRSSNESTGQKVGIRP